MTGNRSQALERLGVFVGGWVLPGAGWEHDFDLTYRRAS